MMNRFCDIDFSSKRLPPVYGYHSEKLVSIEQALEPIQSEIEELRRYIKIAKRYCHFPSEHELTRDQSAAIYIYTMEWGDSTLYRVLNKALQSENRRALKIWFPYLKLFDTALDKLPTVTEILWRGVPFDISKTFTKSQILTWWSINSCSSSIDVIKNFFDNNNNSTLFLIEAINGKNISAYTEYKNEDEVILRMGTQLLVKSTTLDDPNGSQVVHLVEVDDDSDEPLASVMNEMHVTTKPSNEGTLDAQIKNKAQDHNIEDAGASRANESAATAIASATIFVNKSEWPQIPTNATWTQEGIAVAGRIRHGSGFSILRGPHGLYVDDDQTLYIADRENHRIVEWKSGATSGQVVAGGNGNGNGSDQLNGPTDVIVDKGADSLIICDKDNQRVVRWARRGGTSGETIISGVDCRRLTMDDEGFLYVSDGEKHAVRRWRIGETNGTVVAGGNGQGNGLDQLSFPTHVFVDRDHSVYVSDFNNHRVMKWMKGAKEGIVVAGGQSEMNDLTRLAHPQGVVVDQLGTVYVADMNNHRVMCWPQGATQGSIVVGGKGQGRRANQLHRPMGLAFDRQNNLYVADASNHRVQRFPMNRRTVNEQI